MSMTDRNGKEVLLIFVKNPRLGKVKTRLAETVGKEKALKIYQRLLDLTRDITSDLECDRQLWYSGFIDKDDQWEESLYEKKLQKGSGLGERMENGFREAFDKGYERVVIIGSDCAQLRKENIERAFAALEDHDIVIGPSKDGGYYLLGMRAPYPQLLDNKEWSTDSVYQETVAQLKELNLSFKRLALLNDIDTEQDMIDSGARLGRL